MEQPVLRLNSGYPDSSPELQGAVRDLQRELVRWGFDIKPDGKLGPGTEGAVKIFQRKHGLRDDGIVGSATWSALKNKQPVSIGTGYSPASSPPPSVAGSGGGEYFPFARVYSQSWTRSPGAFGSGRGSARAHAGADLYAPLGTWIHAIKAGKVILGPYAFYASTFAIEVDHGDFIARYGALFEHSPWVVERAAGY